MEISKSKVAIVIPNAGGEIILDKCLKSIFNNTLIDYELCIVSQGELGSHEYLRKLETKELFKTKDSKGLYVHYNEINEPGSKGYNRGIKLAYEKVKNFDYLLFLDDDIIIWKQGWLNNLALYLDQNIDVGIVGYKLCCLGEVLENGSTLEIMSCCMLCRRELIDKIGWMDEDLLWHKNDSDYCLRCWQAGNRVKVIYANDYKDISNDYMRHIHQIATKRLQNEKELREKTYKIYDKKWKGIEIKVW